MFQPVRDLNLNLKCISAFDQYFKIVYIFENWIRTVENEYEYSIDLNISTFHNLAIIETIHFINIQKYHKFYIFHNKKINIDYSKYVRKIHNNQRYFKFSTKNNSYKIT